MEELEGGAGGHDGRGRFPAQGGGDQAEDQGPQPFAAPLEAVAAYAGHDGRIPGDEFRQGLVYPVGQGSQVGKNIGHGFMLIYHIMIAGNNQGPALASAARPPFFLPLTA